MGNMLKELKKWDRLDTDTLVVFVLLSVLTVLSLFLPPNFFVLLSVLLLSAVFVWNSPQAGILAALAATMIFGEHFSLYPLVLNENVYKIYALDLVVGMSFVLWFLKQQVGSIKVQNIFKQKKSFWLLIFFAFIFLTTLRTVFFGIGDSTLAFATLKNYSYLLMYFIVLFMFPTRKDLYRLIKVLVWMGIPLLLFIIYGFVNGAGLWSEVTPGRRYLSGLHTFYVTFGLLAAFVMATYRTYIYGRLKTLGIVILQLAGLVGSMFRHLWLGVATSILVILSSINFKQKKQFFRYSFIVLTVIIGLGLVATWATGILGLESNLSDLSFLRETKDRLLTITQTGDGVESAAGWRIATWNIALDKFLDSPIIGIGFGQRFFFEYKGFVDLVDIRSIHNDFVSILVQLGIIGFVPFLMFSFYQARGLRQAIASKKEEDTVLAQILAAWWVVGIFGVFFAIYLMFNGTSIFYWTVMAMISILIKENK